MRPLASAAAALLAVLASAPLATATTQTAKLYYQPVVDAGQGSTPAPPTFFAEITFDPSFSTTTAEIASYEAPELADAPSDAGAGASAQQLVRIGTYDASRKLWTSAVSVTAADTFTRKGYAPHLVLDVGVGGGSGGGNKGGKVGPAVVLGAAARGVAIDAGATRDFGPKAVVRVAGPGKGPEVGRPVVLGADGKKKDEEQEKSLFQKYWWVLGIVFVLVLGGGGGDK